MSRETNLQLLWKLSYIQSVTVDLFRNSYCGFGTIARLTFYLILYHTLMLFLLLGCILLPQKLSLQLTFATIDLKIEYLTSYERLVWNYEKINTLLIRRSIRQR